MSVCKCLQGIELNKGQFACRPRSKRDFSKKVFNIFSKCKALAEAK